MKEKAIVNIFWYRRDLRVEDNAGLYHALKSEFSVLPIFIFDTEIIDELPKNDARIQFIYNALEKLHTKLKENGSSLTILKGKPLEIFEEIAQSYTIKSIYTNKDYEAYALQRDVKVAHWAKKNDIGFLSYKDQVIFDGLEITKKDQSPYSIFTPYYNKWMENLNPFYIQSYPTEKYTKKLYSYTIPFPTLESIGFQTSNIELPSFKIPLNAINEYDKTRDFPSLENGTSKLGIHLRFGTLSIRKLVQLALKSNATYLKELVWREFYQMILQNFPQINENKSFKPEYDKIIWRNNEKEFELWKLGKTGFPIVDAGMRELNATGHMHNRVRMITASFLTKNLLIDWRWGEAYFAEKLLDFEFASNNGGWQWAAGSGCDAAPYFRVFNPQRQTEKFDPKAVYIQKWIPEFNSLEYPTPIVDFKESRERCLSVYAAALRK